MPRWLISGPYPDPDETGYATVFPPENANDPSRVGEWKPFAPATTDGRVDLAKAVAPIEGAVAYAFAVVRSPVDQSVEIRAGADDNLAAWVNGKKVIDHPTYRSHFRADWHRAKVELRAGDNTVLVKVCQCPADPERGGRPNKWEFLLRFVDASGRGASFAVVRPEEGDRP